MNIQNVQSYNYSPQFRSWKRTVLKESSDKAGSVARKYRNDTNFFRDNGFWPRLSDFLVTHFKDSPKVNVYSYGCSNGSEPYTFIMQMLTSHPDIAEKFFPVIARDFDPVAISAAKSNNILIDGFEYMSIDYYTKSNINRFFDVPPEFTDIVNNIEYRTIDYTLRMPRMPNKNFGVKPELSDRVEFSQSDILKDYKQIKEKDSLIFARNFWPYLGKNDMNNLASNLGKHLKTDSVLVIGEYDIDELYRNNNFNIEKLILDNGFKQTNLVYAFIKK